MTTYEKLRERLNELLPEDKLRSRPPALEEVLRGIGISLRERKETLSVLTDGTLSFIIGTASFPTTRKYHLSLPLKDQSEATKKFLLEILDK